MLFWLCKQKGIKIPDLLWLTHADDHDVFGCSIIPFCLQSQTKYVIEIIYGRGKFVGDFNMGRGKFVGDFNMGTL
jgi:hypothetical protein